MLGLGIGAGGVSVLAVLFFLMTRVVGGGAGNAAVPAGSHQQAAASQVVEARADSMTVAASPAPAESTRTRTNAQSPTVSSPASSLTSPAAVSTDNLVVDNVDSTSTSVESAPDSTPVPSTPVVVNRPAMTRPARPNRFANTAASTAPVTGSFVELSMPELIAKIEKSVVRIVVKSDDGLSVGSGFVIESDGTIMTNYHVIEGAKSAVAEFNTGKKYNVLGFTAIDTDRDMAIIKIKPDTTLQKVPVAAVLPMKGEKVAAFGAPRGLSFTASDGIVSAIRNCPDPEFKARTAGCYLQTTTPISPGNSGGPLVNMRGEVVGINSFKMQGENLNFAVSAKDVRDLISHPGKRLIALSPETVPRKFTDKSDTYDRAENLAGTTRGNLLLGQIRDAVIVMLPFKFNDPSKRVADFVESQVEKSLIKKAGWTKVTDQSQVRPGTALVVVLFYFQVAEGIANAEKKNINELKCRVRIVTRDIDKDGAAYTSIVWDEDGTLGTVTVRSLQEGLVPPAMRGKISDFFNKIVIAHRKAKHEAESEK